MADRNAAEIFGFVFATLAEKATERDREVAAQIFERRVRYDFSDYQMECGDALRRLGLPVEAEEES